MTTQNDIGEKVRESLFWAFLLRGGGSCFKVVFTIILARILDPKDFGIMAIASMIVYYADNLTSFGFSNALIQKKELSDADVDTTFTVNFIISLTLCLICVFFSSSIAHLFKVPEAQSVIAVFSLIFLLTTFFDIPITLLKKQINFKYSETFKMARALLQSFIAVILALLGLKVWALVYGQLIGLFVVAVAIVFVTKWHPRFRFHLSNFKGLVHFGAWDFFRNQIGYLGKYGPQFIVSRYVGVTELGFFEKAISTTGMAVDQVSMNMNNVMFSAFSSIQDDQKAIAQTLQHYLVVRTAIGFPVVTGLALIAPYFVPIVLGTKWSPIIIPMQIICLSEGLRMIIGLLSVANVAIGKYALHTIYKTINSILLLVFCYLLLQWNIVGVCLGLVFGDLLSLFASFKVFQSKLKVFHIKSLLHALAPATFGCIIMACCFIFFQRYIFCKVTLTSMIGLILVSALPYTFYMLTSKNTDLQMLKKEIFGAIDKIISKIRAS